MFELCCVVLFQLEALMPLINSHCSRHIRFFLCSVYAPLCSEHVIGAIPSCRGLCEEVKTDCLPALNDLMIIWPALFNCSKFPVSENNGLCMQNPINERKEKYTVALKPKPLICPRNFVATQYLQEPQCSPRCDVDALYRSEDKSLVERWIRALAWLCFTSTLFTLLTFWVDGSRFRYPERPVIFIGFCYNLISFVMIMKSSLGPNVLTCVTDEVPYIAVDALQSPTCTFVFLILYYLSMSAGIWWVILTLAWYLSAAKKWSSEALNSLSTYYHIAAWGIPAVYTQLALALHHVSGDELTGLCYISEPAILVYLIIPYTVLLLIGTVVGVFSAAALMKVRKEVREVGRNTIKLERLIARLTVFWSLYTMPAVGTLACLLYEWWQTPQAHALQALRAIDCDAPGCQLDVPRVSQITITLLRLFLFLFVGISSGMWVWSSKTCRSWTKLFVSPSCTPSSKSRVLPIARV